MTGTKDKRSRQKMQEQLGDKFLDLLIAQGVHPEDLPEDLKGVAVHIPQVNFDVPLELKVRAKMGPPPYAVRAKYIEDLVEKLERDLEKQWRDLAEAMAERTEHFKKVWTAVVETLELDELNALIKEHNTFYPIEANLQPHPETGQIMMGATPWKPKKKVSAADLLKKFPPELERALEG
ncbi:MAG TPA: hypothetical protein VM658_11115 [bacterium]|nr:hypothetical protein [bacterium]